uniref:Uncharacterized protein n=1 Tax=Anopheles funestus TaxID=62324 RepID=A0A182R2T1_ANOFN
MRILKEKLGEKILLELSCKSHAETVEMWRKVFEALEGKAKARPRTPTIRLTCMNVPPSCTNEEIAMDLSAALAVTIYTDQITTEISNYRTLVAFFGCPEVAVTDDVLLQQHVVGFSQCCRFKKVEVKRQCYRCYEFGRGKDLSSRCHRRTGNHQGTEVPRLQGPESNRAFVGTAQLPACKRRGKQPAS